jgi:hypothetical protein
MSEERRRKKEIERAEVAEKDRVEMAKRVQDKADSVERDERYQKVLRGTEVAGKDRAGMGKKAQEKADIIEKDRVETAKRVKDKADQTERDERYQKVLRGTAKSKE